MIGALTILNDAGSGACAAETQSAREFLQRGWQSAAASYHDLWGELTRQAVEPMLEALVVSAGSAVLDVACGPGYVACAAARRGAHAVGIDFSDAMVRIATQLHPEAEFRTGDAEKLPFKARRFSAVAMNFSVHHFVHPQSVLSEARRVLRPGGRVAFSVWASPDVARGASIVYAALKAHGTMQAQLPPEPPLWRLDAPDAACRVLREAGFVDPVVASVAQTWRLDSSADFWRSFYDGSVRTKALLRAQSASALALIRRAIDESLRQFECGGHIEIPMSALLVSARRRVTQR